MAITALAVAMALGILPMVSIGILAPFLIDDLDISRTDLGVLVAVVAGVSALLSPVAGAIVDRIGDRGALLVVLGTGALSLALMAAAMTFVAMSLALVIAGLARRRRQSRHEPPDQSSGCRAGAGDGSRASSSRARRSRSCSPPRTLPAAAGLWGWRAPLLVLAAAAGATLLGATFAIEGTHRAAHRSRRPASGACRARSSGSTPTTS